MIACDEFLHPVVVSPTTWQLFRPIVPRYAKINVPGVIRADFSHLSSPEAVKVRLSEVGTLGNIRVIDENTLADTEWLIIDYVG
jgi:hypothetical protein